MAFWHPCHALPRWALGAHFGWGHGKCTKCQVATCFMRSCTRGRTNPPWYLACCRCAWWRAWHHFAMCRHTLLTQRFPLFFFCSIFGLFVANFFFSMALFESCGTSCTGNVLNHSPKPKATCPPMVWWLSILIGFAPLCRGGVHHACKGRAHGGSCCGMFKVPRKQNSTAGPRALWVVLGGTQCCRL